MLSYETEQTLLKGCLKKEAIAQRKLYALLAGKMLAVCKRYLKEMLLAEDVLVRSFLKVFSKIEQFKNAGSLEGWVRKIVVHECLNELRKQRLLYAEVDIQKHKSIQYDSPDNDLAADELLQLIEELPTGYRTIFNLYAIEGYAHKEIAAMLNISEGTSKSQLSRARVLLQEMLAKSNTYKLNS